MPVIMGTAGHIDHGKTTLIKALTGIDCDRLAEERKRGITIELGFAFLDLAEDLRLGIIDVPGHERFVKNMVAGAAGIDFVVLVIAADEGVMPQTREHLEICSLLGISAGVVALTKTDMVDEEWLELVREDVREALTGTFLEEARMIPVSAHTGLGLEELRSEITSMAREYAPKRRSDLFRLPVDRVFTMRGYGTVVTGTSFSGRLRVGDEVLVYPEGKETRIRGLQVHGKSTDTAGAGLRTAVNLSGLEVSDLERGQVLAHPDTLFPSRVWDLELTCLASARKGIKHRTELHFHHGAREILARIYLLDRDVLEPGETALCQVRFPSPMVGVFGDRCILRSFSPLQTIAGARIINPLGRKVKRFSREFDILGELASRHGQDLVLSQLAMAGAAGLRFAELRIMTDMESRELEKILQSLGGKQQAVLFDKEERRYVHGELARELSTSLVQHLGAVHREQPMRPGVSRGELASGWGRTLHPKLFHALLERLLRQGEVVAEQEVVHLPGHKVSLAADQEAMRTRVTDMYAEAGLMPPTVKVVAETLDVTEKELAPMLKHLQEQGVLMKISQDLFFAVQAVDRMKQDVLAFFDEHRDMGPADFKEITGGLTRKFIIPLLEYLDKEKITMRVGDVRQLRSRF
jgi:selenocysteine-specific elongation factor